MKTELIIGSKLNPSQKREALACFVHRWTHENARQSYGGKCPACEQAGRKGRIETGGAEGFPLKVWTREGWHAYHAPIVSDEQWLSTHAFHIDQSGHISAKHPHCEPAYMARELIHD